MLLVLRWQAPGPPAGQPKGRSSGSCCAGKDQQPAKGKGRQKGERCRRPGAWSSLAPPVTLCVESGKRERGVSAVTGRWMRWLAQLPCARGPPFCSTGRKCRSGGAAAAPRRSTRLRARGRLGAGPGSLKGMATTPVDRCRTVVAAPASRTGFWTGRSLGRDGDARSPLAFQRLFSAREWAVAGRPPASIDRSKEGPANQAAFGRRAQIDRGRGRAYRVVIPESVPARALYARLHQAAGTTRT